MSEGLSVVITDAQEGLRDFVMDGVSGVVVPANSVDALAAAMRDVAVDNELRNRLGQEARLAVAPCSSARAVAAWTAALNLAVPGA